MSRNNDTDGLYIVDLLMDNDPETIQWLRRLGLIEVDADGRWHATDLARNAMSRSCGQLVDIEVARPPRSSLH
jgi:hypothetical protein